MRQEYERKLKNYDFLGALEMISAIDLNESEFLNKQFVKVLEKIDKKESKINTTKTEMDKIDRIIHALGHNEIRK